MAAGTSPSLTSTSHTLSGATAMSTSEIHVQANNGSLGNGMAHDGEGAVLALLASLQSDNRHTFLQPSSALPTDALQVVKSTLEAFSGEVGDEQQERRNKFRAAAGRGQKRKRADGDDEEVLQTRKVYVDGFETGQVWQQAKRIIGSVLRHSDRVLEEIREQNQIALNGVHDESASDADSLSQDDGGDEDSDIQGDSELDAGELDDVDAEADSEEDLIEDNVVEGVSGDDDDDQEDDDELEDDDEPRAEYVEDPDGLNDGFFSLDNFNKQTQWFEEQDARGDPNTDAASDDEEVDWAVDPLAPAKSAPEKNNRKSKKPAEEVEEEEDDDDEGGPTFGNMSLDAPEGASDDEDKDVDDAGEDNDFNANDVFYKDFFALPPRKSDGRKPKKSVKFAPKQPDGVEVERAMADVRKDLFDDESDAEFSEDALSDVSAGDPKSRRSAHERRQAKIAEEIRKLEAASVAKREWTLSGEAAAVDRPMNSLLEEDLDFEHVGKPVPVITPEISEGVEDLIKRRILAEEFDEVIRRRPDAESVPRGTRRGMVELDDSKPNKSLAEVYEEEHIKNADPEGYVSKSDEKLQREEKEIEAMWHDLSARLDSLSSWRYKPKPAAPTLSVVADVGTISMEDAQPATAQGFGSGVGSTLAPQEVYAAGRDTAAKGEVITKGGIPLARQELSRDDKARRRRREKERVRKAGGLDALKAQNGGAGAGPKTRAVSQRAKMQRETMADLKKGGVKVINRKGEIMDVEGNKAKKARPVTSGSYKL